ncbi:hypothetical protein [Amycolatopsis taiwanensis]|uniref:Uncharacterized protein n=1 Tax=Amycolatopsis taiwanensis TaxID=342230 RepID=A0A9W6VG60_9PSEU|nr:hypothetical protein [Amycolatopsis taiwanensis]GLY70403.1 hypothetical protein Atai01_70220 [Amycolatopsis taiwanensis]
MLCHTGDDRDADRVAGAHARSLAWAQSHGGGGEFASGKPIPGSPLAAGAAGRLMAGRPWRARRRNMMMPGMLELIIAT